MNMHRGISTFGAFITNCVHSHRVFVLQSFPVVLSGKEATVVTWLLCLLQNHWGIVDKSWCRYASEEVRQECAFTPFFLIPHPRPHINLYIEYDFNYKKDAQRRTDVVPPLGML